MGTISADDIQAFLKRVGERYPQSGTLYLLGGCALILMGSPRPTVDLDYASDVSSADVNLRNTLRTVADEMRLELEDVSFGEFIPLPAKAHERHRLIGQYGQLQVYAFDPYSIALSKVARGFESDLQDVVFLLRRKLITLKQLENYFKATLSKATEFDIHPQEYRRNWETLRRMAKR